MNLGIKQLLIALMEYGFEMVLMINLHLKSHKKQKPKMRWLHRRILSNI